MNQSGEIAAQALDHPHVLLHLFTAQREALVLPHIVPANTMQYQVLSIELEDRSSYHNVTKSCATGELVGTFVGSEVGPEFIKAWFLG